MVFNCLIVTFKNNKLNRKIQMKRQMILMMLFLGLVTTQAQKQFSLKEAVDYALEHNRSLKEKRYDAEKSESAYKETRAGWMPQVEATLDFMTYFGYEMEFDLMSGSDFTPSATDLTNAQQAATAAAAQLGGTFDPAQYVGATAYEQSIMSVVPPTTIEMGGSSTAQLQVGQMLFNGQLLVGIRAAKKGIELAKKSIELSELDVREGVSNAYYSVLVLEETKSTIEKSVAEMEALIHRTAALVKTGMMEEVELDQLRVQFSNLRTSELALDRNIQITYNLLRFQLGMKVNEPLELTDDVTAILALLEQEKSMTEGFNVGDNVTYQLIDKQVELSEDMVEMEKMSYAPTVTAFYAYNAKILTSGFDMTPNHVAGATLNIPIFSSGVRKNKVKQSQLDLMKAENNRELVRESLQMQESQLRLTYISKSEEYQNQMENVKVSRRVYESYERKFEQGMISGMELTQANTNYLEAESRYYTAALTLLQARVAFLKMLNSL